MVIPTSLLLNTKPLGLLSHPTCPGNIWISNLSSHLLLQVDLLTCSFLRLLLRLLLLLLLNKDFLDVLWQPWSVFFSSNYPSLLPSSLVRERGSVEKLRRWWIFFQRLCLLVDFIIINLGSYRVPDMGRFWCWSHVSSPIA